MEYVEVFFKGVLWIDCCYFYYIILFFIFRISIVYSNEW